MEPRVSYELSDGIATITIDDGKVNALSPALQREIHAAFDQAEADRAAVILTGREGIFSAGFDLRVLRGDLEAGIAMVRSGLELSMRLLAFPYPIVVASTGHAIAMGTFLVCSGDYRIGVSGEFKYVANEVAIGLTVPRAAIEILRLRLTPSALQRAIGLAETFTPDDALAVGILDRLVPPAELAAAARATALSFSGLDLAAHHASKVRARERSLAAMRTGLELDAAE